MATSNPFLVELFKDPKYMAADLQFLLERHKAMQQASQMQPVYPAGGGAQTQQQAATLMTSDPRGFDPKAYPPDQGMMNLPVANANALANRQANIAMTDVKANAKKRIKGQNGGQK